MDIVSRDIIGWIEIKLFAAKKDTNKAMAFSFGAVLFFVAAAAGCCVRFPFLNFLNFLTSFPFFFFLLPQFSPLSR